jgi:hypothetical protein
MSTPSISKSALTQVVRSRYEVVKTTCIEKSFRLSEPVSKNDHLNSVHAYILNNPNTSLNNPNTSINNPNTSLNNPNTSLNNPNTSINNPNTSLNNPNTMFSPISSPYFPALTNVIDVYNS